GARIVNDHQWTPLGLFRAASHSWTTRIDLPGGADPWDILVRASHIYVLSAIENSSSDGYWVTVSSSTDLDIWQEQFRFQADTFARSFELHDGIFYFGLGTNTSPLEASAGAILRVNCFATCFGRECGDDACGASCGSCTDPFLCESGTCECPEDLDDCGGACVDLQTNNDHCGECDNGCGTDAVCILGICSPTCGDTTCDGAENCENCPVDCPTAGDEVCCSGVLHSGDCCDGQDCTAPDTCIGWSCLPPSTCENDADGDHYGVGASCAGPDCDDEDPAVHPGAIERCDDEIDNDCDGATDEEDPDCPTCVDADEDGFESANCGGDDCDDSDSTVSPDAAEVCGDEIDNDCDGLVDENCRGEVIIGGCRAFPCDMTAQAVVAMLLLIGCVRSRGGSRASS
ncbi:MopE-related protein, partial [Myxococcota bacterium]